MKKLLALILALCMVAALCACGQQTAPAQTATPAPASAAPATDAAAENVDYSKLTIAWSPANLSNELQVTLTDCIKASVEALGATYLSADPQGDPVSQVEQVENYISRGVDMILMSPNDASACGVVLQEAVDAGIPMIIVNCKMDDMEGSLCYVGCDDLTAGEILMTYAADMLGGKGTIGILRGPDGLDAAIKRTTGIDNILAENPDIVVFSSQAANWKTAEAMSTTENWLQSTELNAIVCENDEMAVGAVEAIKGQGKSCDDILVFGIDGIPSAYESINNGEMKATLLQDAAAIADKTIEVMQLYFDTGAVESEYIIPWTVVDSSNIADYYNK